MRGRANLSSWTSVASAVFDHEKHEKHEWAASRPDAVVAELGWDQASNAFVFFCVFRGSFRGVASAPSQAGQV